MNTENKKQTRNDIINFCTEIGQDPMYVQGAGGNVSWKDSDTLWIKASGTWLINAGIEDIFLPVDLTSIKSELESKKFNVTPSLKIESKLRPSIETILHALMPHKVVVHLHAIEILAHLVRSNCIEIMTPLINDTISWKLVDYHKPGASLAEAVSLALTEEPNLDVIFLKNHGIVIGGNTINDVNEILIDLNKSLKTIPQLTSNSCHDSECNIGSGYAKIDNRDIQALALNTGLFSFLASNWALYPDHVVFLGAYPHIYKSVEEFNKERETSDNSPDIIFILGVGVFTNKPISQAMIEQLTCYFNVIVRQYDDTSLAKLNNIQISELLNWDAEKYRMSLSK
jgi:rhamnose utilization protein RhaD (predicted bifunctional aldolase and dehydrogenase)